MAAFQIAPPETLDCASPDTWPVWIRRFERFRTASGLEEKDGKIQISTLVYAMGPKAEEILSSFTLTEEQAKSYNEVRSKFDTHFVARRNVIFERAKFNQRVQEPEESVDSFVTALYSLSEHCVFGDLHDELIRDRIVVGLRDASLSETLQLDSELTLEKAISKARQKETVKQQQVVIRKDDTHSTPAVVEAIRGRRLVAQTRQRKTACVHKEKSSSSSGRPMARDSCTRCGQKPSHGRAACPAVTAKCHKCERVDHYARMCKSKQKIEIVSDASFESDDSRGYLCLGVRSMGTVTGAWMTNAKVNGRELRFKIDTGADVTVIPEKVYKTTFSNAKLQPVTRHSLRGPGGHALDVRGKFVAKLQVKALAAQQEIFVVSGMTRCLLGRPAIEALQVIKRCEIVQKAACNLVKVADVQAEFPNLFKGLGKMKEEYTICLKSDTKPFALSTPRRIPIPLMKKVEDELLKMQVEGVISKVDLPTDWCSGMVIVPKPNGRVRVCVDMSKLNESVKRERMVLPSVEHTLAQLQGARVFSKIDANSGFWQIPLSNESALLTTFITPFGRFCYNRLPFGITLAPELFQKKNV
ncbi:uncharacterized protein K02A2.6-like [Corticium candelabrum]|uniref:uncharacterized protein K02A2.6-like n=1 Tax=Corticium candelabrum TaxID=121492 RepID=UPI002E274052|nr:uncharacterized protein K02A2.6-like [Corticium candelabrum]